MGWNGPAFSLLGLKIPALNCPVGKIWWSEMHNEKEFRDEDMSDTEEEKLLTSEDSRRTDPVRSGQTERRPSSRRLLWLSVTAVILLAALGVTVLVAMQQGHEIQLYEEFDNCGTTPEEARANGCIYEPMQRSWIPKRCYTPEPGGEYHPFDDRTWYYDKNRTKQITGSGLDLLRNGEEIVAYTREFHNEHCLYCWRKMATALHDRMPYIDTKTFDLHHATHCSKLMTHILKDMAGGKINPNSYTVSPLMFQRCVRIF